MTHRRPCSGLVACLLVVLAACQPQTAPDRSDEGPAVDYHVFETPEKLGTGLIDGATPDGAALYVEEPDPAFPAPACEGRPGSVMFRQPLDGSDRTVVGNGTDPHRGRLVGGGSGNRIAVVAACESFFTDLTVAEQAEDGSLSKITRVQPAVPEGFLLNPSTVAWSNNGRRLLAAIQDIDAPDGDPAQIVSIDPGTGEITRLFEAEQGTGVFNVGQMQNGDYVVATNLVVSFRDRTGNVVAGFQGHDFQIAPDRRSMVVFGRTVRLATQGESTAPVIVPEKEGLEVSFADFSPDGRAVAFERYAVATGLVEISVLTPADKRVTNIVTGDDYDRPVFTGDGKALAFNLYAGEPDYLTEVYVARFEPK